MSHTIGLDIGGTKIAGGLVAEDGTILVAAKRATPAQDPSAIAGLCVELVDELRAQGDVSAVGIACAGFIDVTRSIVAFAPNLAWRDEPLKARISERVDLPIVVENDANAAAWGEFVHGGAEDADSMFLLTIGTGVGGGVVIEGRLLRGSFGMGAELGHMRVVPDGLRCGCGNRGCLEMYGSGSALVREARELVASGSPHAGALSDRCGGDPARLKGKHVTELAHQGDAASTELIADLGRWIGEGAASLAAILDPEVILIGGGVADAGDLLMDPVRTAFGRNLIGRGHRPVPQLRLAALGNDAGLIGAAAAAREAVGA
jgi:glucokinase